MKNDMFELDSFELNELYQFTHNNTKILLNVNTSDFFEVHDIIYDIIEKLKNREDINTLYKSYSREEVADAINELLEREILKKKAKELQFPRNPDDISLENVVLHLSHDCNMRCKYCFANSGDYNGEREYMTKEIARQSLEWAIEQSKGKHFLNILLFGGEPLLNIPVLKDIVAYSRALSEEHNKKICLNISTNGTILTDEVMKLFRDNDVGIQLSIDGPKHIHDKFRILRNGSGSYDIIIKNLKRLLAELPANYIIPRATIAHGEVDIIGVTDHLFSLGFNMVFFTPALGCGSFVIDNQDKEAMISQYNELAEVFIERKTDGKDYNVFPLYTEVYNIGNSIKRTYGCGAGLGFCSIAVNGDIYPCMRFTNIEKYRIGDIFNGFDKNQRKVIADRSVDFRNGCKDCWARYFCGGACVAVPAVLENDMLKQNTIACELSKHIIKLAMYINARLSKYGITLERDKTLLDFIRRRIQ